MSLVQVAPAQSRRGSVPLVLIAATVLLGGVSAALVGRGFYQRRVKLTTEWLPHFSEQGPEAFLTGGVPAGSIPIESLDADEILFRVDGDNAGDYFGWSTCGLDDVNGDGVADFAVGGHQLVNASVRPDFNLPQGYVRVFSGADGSELYTVRPEGSLHIDSSDDVFGWSLASLPDIDGDGAPELIVGAPLYDFEDPDESEIDENTGAVFIFSGATGKRIALLGGERWGDRFGYTVSAGPDVDQDGLADLLIGVEKGETNHAVKNAGRVEVWSSATFKRLSSANGPGMEGRMGHSLTVLEDLDGDGTTDFASGAYYYGARESVGTQRGAVGIFSGATGTLLHALEGGETMDNLGGALCSLGGIGNDSWVASGAIQSGFEAEYTGTYFGPGYVRIDSAVDGELAGVLVGAELGDQFGWALANAGDTDGDGFDDLLVGAPASITFTENKLDRPGRVYLFSGASKSPLKAFAGLSINDQFGASITRIGDLNGDGVPEVLIGATQNVAHQSEPGYAVVISGRVFASLHGI